MAKITVKRLTMGGEYHEDVIFDGPSQVLAQFNTSGVNNEQLERGWGRFHIPFHVPWVDSKYFHENRDAAADNLQNRRPMLLPLPLVTLQEYFDPTVLQPPIQLEHVMFGFDQGDVPVGKLSQWYGHGFGNTEDNTYYHGVDNTYQFPNPYESFNAYDRSGAYTTWLGIFEKDQMFFEGDQQFASARSQIQTLRWQAEFGAGVTDNPTAHPLLLPAAGIQLRPLRTYVLALDLPDLHDDNAAPPDNLPRHCAMYSIWIVLTCKMPLLPRDIRLLSALPPTLLTHVQNEPASSTDAIATLATSGTKPGAGLITTTPKDFAAGTVPMEANVESGAFLNSGFADVLRRIDKEVEDGLRGGYRRSGLTRPFDQLADDASFWATRVNLGQGFKLGALFMEDILSCPHSGEQGEKGVWLFGFVPVPTGVVIHQVILALNWTSGLLDGSTTFQGKPPDGDLEYRCGVTISPLGQGDQYGYQQVANVVYDDVSGRGSDYLIDVIDWDVSPVGGGATLDDYIGALIDVPLVNPGDPAIPDGAGYTTYAPSGDPFGNPWGGGIDKTGPPFYCGEGLGDAGVRMHVGSGQDIPGGTATEDQESFIKGAERYITVRLHIIPTGAAPFSLPGPTWSGTYNRDDVLVGYGGHAVYLFGKRPVVAG